MERLHLPPPAKKQDVAAALKMHHDAGDAEHKQQWVNWTWAHRWMNGIRSDGTRAGSPSGIPTPTHRDSRGHRRVRFEKIIPLVQTEIGRILSIDTRPAIDRRRGLGLGGLRAESISQAACDYVDERVQSSGIRAMSAFMAAVYGPVGLGVVPGQQPNRRWLPQVILIPPWELRPLPASPLGMYEVAGIEWCRWVPFSWLKKAHKGDLKFPSGSAESLTEKLGLQQAPPSSPVRNDAAPPSLSGLFPTGGTALSLREQYESTTRSGDPELEYYVQLRESFIRGDGDTMTRYVVMLGDQWVAADRDFTSQAWQERLDETLPAMLVHVGGYQESASFYPRSFLSRLLPLNREVEFLLGDGIDNHRKMAKLRKLAIPGSSGTNIRNLKAHANDPWFPWMPDYMAPTLKPQILEPGDISETYGNMINMCASMLQDLSGQGPLLRGQMPNRADSALAADRAAQENDVPLMSCGELMEQAWAGTWRACLFHMRTYTNRTINPLAPDDAIIKIGRIDEGVLGLKIDRDKGTVALSDYTIPDPHELKVSIRDKNPRSKAAILEYLQGERDAGRMSQAEYEIAIVKESLDVPIVQRGAYNAYEAAWLENVLIFGDGETPGHVYGYQGGDNHSIHYLVHMELANSMTARVASDAVQTLLTEHILWHRKQLSNWTDRAVSVDTLGGFAEVAPGPAAAAGRQVPAMRTPTE